MAMEQARLIDSALMVIFCDSDIENGRHPSYSGVASPLETLKLRLP
jgi:hypothetical protein